MIPFLMKGPSLRSITKIDILILCYGMAHTLLFLTLNKFEYSLFSSVNQLLYLLVYVIAKNIYIKYDISRQFKKFIILTSITVISVNLAYLLGINVDQIIKYMRYFEYERFVQGIKYTEEEFFIAMKERISLGNPSDMSNLLFFSNLYLVLNKKGSVLINIILLMVFYFVESRTFLIAHMILIFLHYSASSILSRIIVATISLLFVFLIPILFEAFVIRTHDIVNFSESFRASLYQFGYSYLTSSYENFFIGIGYAEALARLEIELGFRNSYENAFSFILYHGVFFGFILIYILWKGIGINVEKKILALLLIVIAFVQPINEYFIFWLFLGLVSRDSKKYN